ncbi:uracil-DNA glycosylase [Glaciibacter sp. 2TAF33]
MPRQAQPGSLADLGTPGLVHPEWAAALAPVTAQLAQLEGFLAAESAAGRTVLPAGDNVLRAFRYPPDTVRVLIVGQDPYPTPGHAIGLAFAVDREVRPVPRSLANVYTELHSDLGIDPPAHGDLTPWAEHGVMLLNRVLTVEAGVTGSHRRRGWEAVTEHAIRTLVARNQPLVAILWGRDAAGVQQFLGPTPVIESAHPSPLSASRGFFGSRPFSRANALLAEQGAQPVDWSLG